MTNNSSTQLVQLLDTDVQSLAEMRHLARLVRERSDKAILPPDSELHELHQRLDRQRMKASRSAFKIVAVGLEKQGKSTLLNALLGAELLPTADERCTFVITEIVSAKPEQERIEIHFKSREDFEKDKKELEQAAHGGPKTQRDSAAKELAVLAQHEAAIAANLGQPAKEIMGCQPEDLWVWIANPELLERRFHRKGAAALYPAVKKVVIHSPRLSSEEGRILIDTPGYDSTYESHRQMAQEAIADADAFILVAGFLNRVNLKFHEEQILRLLDINAATTRRAMERGFVVATFLDRETSKERVADRRKEIINTELAKYHVLANRVIVAAPKVHLLERGLLIQPPPQKDQDELRKGLEHLGGNTGVEELHLKLGEFLRQDLNKLREEDQKELHQQVKRQGEAIVLSARQVFPGSLTEAHKKRQFAAAQQWNRWFDQRWHAIRDNLNAAVQDPALSKSAILARFWEDYAKRISEVLGQPAAAVAGDLGARLCTLPTEFGAMDSDEIEKSERKRLVGFYAQAFSRIWHSHGELVHELVQGFEAKLLAECFGLKDVLQLQELRGAQKTREERCADVGARMKPKVDTALHRHLRWPKRSFTREHAARNLSPDAESPWNPPTGVTLPGWATETPVHWQHAAIGTVPKSDTTPYRFEGSRLSLRGAGQDVWETNDHCQFIYEKTAGDFVIQARVAKHDRGGKAGLMARDSTGSGKAAMVLICWRPGTFEWLPHPQAGKCDKDACDSEADQLGSSGAPFWLRLKRVGELVSGYVSRDGRDWVRLGRPTKLPAGLLVGLFATCHSDSRLNANTVIFDEISKEALSAPGAAASQVTQAEADIKDDLRHMAGIAQSALFDGEDCWHQITAEIQNLRDALMKERANVSSLFKHHQHLLPNAPSESELDQSDFEALRLRENLERALK